MRRGLSCGIRGGLSFGMMGGLVVSLLASVSVCASGAELASGERAALEDGLATAKELVRQGDYGSAAAAYEALAATHPGVRKGQRAALEAGLNYERVGRIDKAIEQLDLAVSQAVPSDLSEAALYEKAALCEKHGRTDEALKAVAYLKQGFPYSEQLADALAIEGRVRKLSAGQVASMQAREQEGREVLREMNRLLAGDQYASALAVIENNKSRLSGTGASVAAGLGVGQALCRLREYGKASEVLLPLCGSLDAVAPRSEMAQEAKSLLGRALLDYAEEVYEAGIKQRQGESPATWREVRKYVDGVERMGHDRMQVARAEVMRVALDLVEGDSATAQKRAEHYMKAYAGVKKLKKFPVQVLQLHLLAINAARSLHEMDKALALCEKVKSLYGQLPASQQKDVEGSYRQACYQRFLTLRWMKADPAEIQAAGEEVLARFPDSRHAELVQKQLAGGAAERSR